MSARSSALSRDSCSAGPQAVAAPAYARTAIEAATRAYLKLYHRLQIAGLEHLPPRGPFVIVSNHSSHLDAVCLRAILPMHRLPHTFTAVAADYFCTNRLRTFAAKWLANSVPFSRQDHVRGAMRQCRALLLDSRDETSLIFFPEGTRSRDGTLGKFRPGIGALLAGLDLPVVPCAVSGSFQAWPKGTRLARPRAVRVVVGEPRFYGTLARSRQAHHELADDLHDAVERLLRT